MLSLLFLALVLALVVSHLWWGHRAGARLEAQLAAARAAGEPVTVDELNRWPFLRGGSGKNVVPVLRAAAGWLDQNGQVWQSFSQMEQLTPPLTEKEVTTLTAVVEENADALKRLEGVEAMGAVDWQAAYTSPLLNYLTPNSDLNGMRALAQLLHADALLAHRAGDHGRALRRSRQALSISRAVAYQPQIVPHLVALGLSALGTMTAVEVVPELQVAKAGGPGVSPEHVRGLIAELLDERPLNEGWRRAIVGERVMVVDTVQGLVDGRMQLRDLGRRQEDITEYGSFVRHAARPYLLENAAVMAAYDAALLRATVGAPDARAARAALPQGLLDEIRTSKRFLVASILTPTMERAVNVHFRCIAERRLAAVALAVKLYEADHDGRPPETLAALVPDYLAAVPADPMAAGGAPLGYVSAAEDPDRPRVYSVDDNGVDDGGNEPDPDAPRRVREATSDIVRHLKRQPRVFPKTLPWMGIDPGAEKEEESTGDIPATAPATRPATEPAPEEQRAQGEAKARSDPPAAAAG